MLENVFLEVPGGPFWRLLEVLVLIFGSRNRLGVIFDTSKERSKKASEKSHARRRDQMRGGGLPAPIKPTNPGPRGWQGLGTLHYVLEARWRIINI